MRKIICPGGTLENQRAIPSSFQDEILICGQPDTSCLANFKCSFGAKTLEKLFCRAQSQNRETGQATKKITHMDEMDDTAYTVIFVIALVLFAFLTAAVRSSRAKEYLKKHPIKKCPYCAEIVKLEAKVCKHCGRDFASASTVFPQSLSASKEKIYYPTDKKQQVGAARITTTVAEEKFYYSTDGEQQGPVDASDLKLMWQDGLLTNDTLVIREGDPEWRSIRDYLALLNK